jgi:hypothetical protein
MEGLVVVVVVVLVRHRRPAPMSVAPHRKRVLRCRSLNSPAAEEISPSRISLQRGPASHRPSQIYQRPSQVMSIDRARQRVPTPTRRVFDLGACRVVVW